MGILTRFDEILSEVHANATYCTDTMPFMHVILFVEWELILDVFMQVMCINA